MPRSTKKTKLNKKDKELKKIDRKLKKCDSIKLKPERDLLFSMLADTRTLCYDPEKLDYTNYGNHLRYDTKGKPVRPYNTFEEGLTWYRQQPAMRGLPDWCIEKIVYDNLRRDLGEKFEETVTKANPYVCLLYTSDAADE